MRMGIVVLCAVLLAAVQADAGSNVFRCNISKSYRYDPVDQKLKPVNETLIEIIFDANTGHLVEKHKVGKQTVHRRRTFKMIGRGGRLDKGRRRDVTGYWFQPEVGTVSAVVWTVSILFMEKTAKLLYVQRQSVTRGTCKEM